MSGQSDPNVAQTFRAVPRYVVNSVWLLVLIGPTLLAAADLEKDPAPENATAAGNPPDDEKSRVSPLRKSLIDRPWSFMLRERQVPPNHGIEAISLNHEGRLGRGDPETQFGLREPVLIRKLSEEARTQMLDTAVQAREAFSFGYPMKKVWDSASVRLTLNSGRREIRLHVSGASGETNLKLLTPLQELADSGIPRQMQIIDPHWHKEPGRAGDETVWGSWRLSLRMGKADEDELHLHVGRDGTLKIGRLHRKDRKQAELLTTELNAADAGELLNCTLDAVDAFTFDHANLPPGGDRDISLSLWSGNNACARGLEIREKGLRAADLPESFLRPLVRVLHDKLPESKEHFRFE